MYSDRIGEEQEESERERGNLLGPRIEKSGRGRGYSRMYQSGKMYQAPSESAFSQGRGFSSQRTQLPGAEESPWNRSYPSGGRGVGLHNQSRFSQNLAGADSSPWRKKDPPQTGGGFGRGAFLPEKASPARVTTTKPATAGGWGGGGGGFARVNRDDFGERKWEWTEPPKRPEEPRREENKTFGQGSNNTQREEERGGNWGDGGGGGGGMGGFASPGYSDLAQKAKEREKRAEEDNKDTDRKKDFGSGWDQEDTNITRGFGGREVSGDFSGFSNQSFAEIMAEVAKAEKKKWANLPTIRKAFYSEHPEVTAMFPEEVTQLRLEKHNISVTDLSKDGKKRQPPKPVFKFRHAFEQYPDLLSQLETLYSEPSPIQCQLWPVAMSGVDAIGIAQTGSGKTLGFLLPAFLHIDGKDKKERDGPGCLVLTPTRELAQQIEREVRKYKYKGIKSVCVYGGGDRRQQCFDCTEGVDIIIATPGRLNDLVADRVINLKTVSFLPQIKKILLDVRPDRHTIMTSATWPPLVREIAGKYTVDPFLIYVGSLDLTACHAVEQTVRIVDEESKFDILMEFVREMKPEDKALIFVGRKNTADHLSSELIRKRVECQSMHGDRDQRERERALRELRKGTVKLLVATDVASRGLDINDITHVINYDFPRNMEEYVHRVGRTGRAGPLKAKYVYGLRKCLRKSGKSITLMTRYDWRNARDLLRILNEAHQEVPEDLVRMADRFDASEERRRQERMGSFDTRPPPRGGSAWRGEARPPRRGFTDPFTDEWIS